MPLEKRLPPEQREQSTWLHVKNLLHGAACGQDEPGDVEIALRMVMSMEGIECHPQRTRSIE
jgi:hypothetical protein